MEAPTDPLDEKTTGKLEDGEEFVHTFTLANGIRPMTRVLGRRRLKFL